MNIEFKTITDALEIATKIGENYQNRSIAIEKAIVEHLSIPIWKVGKILKSRSELTKLIVSEERKTTALFDRIREKYKTNEHE